MVHPSLLVVNYSSFAKYFHWFKLPGLVEPIDRREPAIYLLNDSGMQTGFANYRTFSAYHRCTLYLALDKGSNDFLCLKPLL